MKIVYLVPVSWTNLHSSFLVCDVILLWAPCVRSLMIIFYAVDQVDCLMVFAFICTSKNKYDYLPCFFSPFSGICNRSIQICMTMPLALFCFSLHFLFTLFKSDFLKNKLLLLFSEWLYLFYTSMHTDTMIELYVWFRSGL